MTHSRFYVSAKGVKIHVLQFGSVGPSVLLLPGITSPAITWSFVAERLAESARVVVLDARGRGLSDHRPGLGHTTGDYASDAACVIEELALAPAIVIGHSMGARVVARLAAVRPDLVGRCVLADPPVSGPGRRNYPSALSSYLEAIELASRGAPAPGKVRLNETQARVRAEWLPTCDPEAVEQSHKAFHEEDFFADLPKIQCDVLLIYAGRGDVVRDSDANEIQSLLLRGRQAKIPDASHMIPFDDLEGFLAALTPFIHEKLD